MFKSTLKLTITSSASLFIGLLSQFFILFYFGMSIETDAHVASITIPLLVSSLFVVTLPPVLVPIILDQAEYRAASWDLMILFGLAFAFLSWLLYLFAPIYMPLLFFGLDAETQKLAIELTRIQIWTILAGGLALAPTALLRAREEILTTEIRSLIASIIGLIVLIPATREYGILGASLALLSRAWINTLLLIPALGFPKFSQSSRALYRAFWERAAPLVFAAPLYKLGPLVDRVLAGMAPMGQLSSLVYGQQLWNSGLRVVDKAVATPFLTHVTKAVRDREVHTLEQEYRSILRVFTLIALVAVVCFWLFGEALISELASVSNFRAEAVFDLWFVALLLGGTFIAGGCSQISSAAMYSLGETHYLTRIAIINFFLSVAAKITLFAIYGVPGIAAACTVYPLLNHVVFHRKFLNVLRSR